MSREQIEEISRNKHNERLSEESNRELSPYRERPLISGEEEDSDKAHDLFALFTSDIIKENKVFTR